MPYQSPPFWCIDDNTRFVQDMNREIKACHLSTKYRRAPPRCVHQFEYAFGMQDTHIGMTLPLYFIN